MRFSVIIFIFSILWSNFSLAQANLHCGSDLLHEHYLNSSPDYAKNRARISNEVSHGRIKSADPIKIPVVVHVIYRTDAQNISDSQIQSQIDVLNNDYNKANWDTMFVPSVWKPIIADVGLEFVLANRDPDGNITTGVTRTQTTIKDIASTSGDLHYQTSKGGQDIWDRNRYLNIWVCEILENIYGFASLPGAPAASDGVVIDFIAFGTEGTAESPTHKGRTGTHEVGHWLDLQHLWAFPSAPPCGDDGLLDTPLQESGNFGCKTYPHNTDCNTTADGEMFMNFMDFSDDPCLNMFTEDQKDKMIGTINNQRSGLLTSDGYNSINEFADFEFKIYPSPAQNELFIEKSRELPIEQLSIYNISGHKIINERVLPQNGKIRLDVSHLSSGMYFLVVQGKGKSLSERILISRP